MIHKNKGHIFVIVTPHFPNNVNNTLKIRVFNVKRNATLLFKHKWCKVTIY